MRNRSEGTPDAMIALIADPGCPHGFRRARPATTIKRAEADGPCPLQEAFA